LSFRISLVIGGALVIAPLVISPSLAKKIKINKLAERTTNAHRCGFFQVGGEKK
jgi:hypothetical protein